MASENQGGSDPNIAKEPTKSATLLLTSEERQMDAPSFHDGHPSSSSERQDTLRSKTNDSLSKGRVIQVDLKD